MNKILLTIKENWEDPVWSKVIAGAILGIASLIITPFYSLATAMYYSISFKAAIISSLETLNGSIELKVWYLILSLIIYLILVSSPLLKLAEDIIFKIKNTDKAITKIPHQEVERAPSHSTPFFHQRMASAFPGIRKLTWFENPKIATKRLKLLLRDPIKFDPKFSELKSTPIWWFRGSSANSISEFKEIGRKKVLMNFDRLKIKRIAAYHSSTYYKDFVYVEVEGEKQTGLYDFDDSDIKRHIDSRGYSWEEYGLIRNFLGWKIPISREEYDDGAAEIRGKVRDAMDAKLRIRFLSKYNFIIAAKGSPYNSTRFARQSEAFLNGILKNETDLVDFFEFIKGFEKHEGRLN